MASASRRIRRTELVDVARLPCREDGAADALARRVDAIGHRLAFGGDDGLARAAVGRALAAGDEAEALELGHLTAHGRVVAPDAVGHIDDADRPEALDPHEQREERPIEPDPRRPDQHLVALRPIHHGDDVEKRAVKIAELAAYMCILHSFS